MSITLIFLFFIKHELKLNSTSYLVAIGSSTENEQLASDSRTSQAPTAQDLQSTIAPQLTSAGTNPENQPEIAQGDEASGKSNLPFIESWPEIDLRFDSEDSYQSVTDVIFEDLQLLRKLSISFVITSVEEYQHLKKYGKLNFLRNTDWIGQFLVPAT